MIAAACRTPGKFVGFFATQKMEFARAFTHRFADRVSNDQAAWAAIGILWIIAREIGVASAMVEKAIIHRSGLRSDAKPVHSQQARFHQSRQSG